MTDLSWCASFLGLLSLVWSGFALSALGGGTTSIGGRPYLVGAFGPSCAFIELLLCHDPFITFLFAFYV